MKLHEAFKPSVILSETHFPYLGQDEVFSEAVHRVGDDGFFKNVEIPNIESRKARGIIAKAAEEFGLSITCWLTTFCASQNIGISVIDETLRKKTVDLLKIKMAEASECGAVKFAVGSGADPGKSQRPAATESFVNSICELCEEAAKYSSMRVIFEPMDRGADKNCLIGPTSEFVAIAQKICKDYDNVGICWDSAHVRLCGDDIFDSLTKAREFVLQMHLSNAILDPNDPEFGDKHMPTGYPGFLTVETIAKLLETALKNNFRNNPLSIEIGRASCRERV